MPASKLISEFLSINGENNTHSILPADATLGTWSWAPAAGKKVALHRAIVSIQDSGSFSVTNYGAGSGLTNGMTLSVHNSSGLLYTLTDDHLPIKTNVHWGAYCYDADVKAWGIGDDFLVARWTFSKSGQPIYLNGDKGEKLCLEVSDTMTQLVEHLVLVQGYYITP